MTIRTAPPEVRYSLEGFELRDTAADGHYLEGVAAPLGKFRDVGPYFEKLDHSVFDLSIKQRGTKLPLMMLHDSSAIPVGMAVSWTKTDDALIGVWRFDTRAEAREAHRLAADGMLPSLSVGFAPGKAAEDNTVEVGEDGNRYVTRHAARLLECSLVATPAFEEAEVLAVRTLGIDHLLPTPTVRRDALAVTLADLDALLGSIPKPL